MNYIVISPFGKYKIGDIVEDPASILGTELETKVIRTATPTTTVPVPKE